MSAAGATACVATVAALPAGALERLLARYGLSVRWAPSGAALPGTFWGEPEAGLVRDRLHLRPDTPVHSATSHSRTSEASRANQARAEPSLKL